MGNVIDLDDEAGSLPSVLTETGDGGLLSAGYLRDAPAIDYLAADEVPAFALTNRKRGVETDSDGDREQITPGSGYRTVCLVTDRRLLVVVGDGSAASAGGDRRFDVELVDVEGVSTEAGRRVGSLTVRMATGDTLTVYCGRSGLDDVADYVAVASQAWIHVANTLDGAERKLADATDRLHAGEHDAALEAALDASDSLEEPRRTATRFDRDWAGPALIERVDRVRDSCAETLALVRFERARDFAADAETRWSGRAYEDAHDAYERAIDEYETVLAADVDALDDGDVRAERDRVERATADLAHSPLRRAAAADRDAANADDSTAAAELWEAALERYRTTLELDWGAERRRFAGDPDAIRTRMGEVVERLVSARRSAANEAKRAGDWYVGSDRHADAVERFEDAREQYELALDVARDRYPDAVDHLTVERDALAERIERAKAARDGEDLGPAPTGDDGDPAYDVEAAIGDVDGAAGNAENEGADADDAGNDERRDGTDRPADAADRPDDLSIEE